MPLCQSVSQLSLAPPAEGEDGVSSFPQPHTQMYSSCCSFALYLAWLVCLFASCVLCLVSCFLCLVSCVLGLVIFNSTTMVEYEIGVWLSGKRAEGPGLGEWAAGQKGGGFLGSEDGGAGVF